MGDRVDISSVFNDFNNLMTTLKKEERDELDDRNRDLGKEQIDDTGLVGDEFHVLKRNYGVLLEALAHEKSKCESLDDDIQELRLQKESECEDYRLQIQRLQGQIRALTSERSLEEVYDVMEEDVMRLKRELEVIRKDNVQLEGKVWDLLEGGASRRNNNNNNNMTSNTSYTNDKEETERDDMNGSNMSSKHENLEMSNTEFTYIYGSPDTTASSLLAGLSKKDTKRLIAQVKQQIAQIAQLKKENEVSHISYVNFLLNNKTDITLTNPPYFFHPLIIESSIERTYSFHIFASSQRCCS